MKGFPEYQLLGSITHMTRSYFESLYANVNISLYLRDIVMDVISTLQNVCIIDLITWQTTL